MSENNQFERRFFRKLDEKKRVTEIQSEDDAPLPDTPVEQVRAEQTAGRNDPCPCGSRKKYKKCCGAPA